MDKAIECFTKNYANFSGRAGRSEYWSFVILTIITILLLLLIDILTGTYNHKAHFGLLSGIFYLAAFVPGIAVKVRRLHDLGKSGLWLFIGVIPVIGTVCLFILYCRKGIKKQNSFGPAPL